jgi:phytoene dehydrogenase-like protein
MVDRVDVVVIGAGLGGLAAGVTAAGQGRHVVVLEQHNLPGGYAQCFQRGPYRFDASLHALNGLAPGGGMDAVYRDLGIWDRLRLRRLDPLYLARFPDRDVVVHADPFRYESDLIGQFPDAAAGIRSYLDEAWTVHRESRRLADDEAAGRAASPDEFVTAYPALVRVSAETWAQTIARHVSDPRLVGVLGALWGYIGLPPELVSALVGTIATAAYGHFGGWYPEGGSAALAWSLEQVLRERGGEVRYAQTVTNVEVSDGRAVAVLTADGSRVETDAVISNASAPTTMLEMVGRRHLPTDYVERVDAPAPSLTTFAVYLGLDTDVFGERGLPHELVVAPGYEPLAGWRAALAGDWGSTGLMVTDYTSVDSGCAPPRGGAVVLSAAASWDYEDTWGTGGDLTGYHENGRYLAVKERVTDEVIRRADAGVPGLADAVRFREASTPLTNFSYTRNPYGAIEGYENTPANSGLGWLPQTTPIPNLFLAGAWTNTGGQNPAIMSGQAAARLATKVGIAVS